MTDEKILYNAIRLLVTKFSIYGLDEDDMLVVNSYTDKLKLEGKEVPDFISDFLFGLGSPGQEIVSSPMIESFSSNKIKVNAHVYLALKDGEEVSSEMLANFFTDEFGSWSNIKMDERNYVSRFEDLRDNLQEKFFVSDGDRKYIFSLRFSCELEKKINSKSEDLLFKDSVKVYDKNKFLSGKNSLIISMEPYLESSDIYSEYSFDYEN